jgi:hypothetical protein
VGRTGGEGEPSSSVSLLPQPVAAALAFAYLRCSLFWGFLRILVLILSRSAFPLRVLVLVRVDC